jgi:basic membrane protein A and related proteins
VMTTNPQAAQALLSSYTGSFNNVAAGKQVAVDMLAKGLDVIYQAAGSDGLGVIQAVKEARAQGKGVWAIGVDSDQSHLAPEAILSSVIKRVDLAVYQAARDLTENKFTADDQSMGLTEAAVTLAPIRVAVPDKEKVLAQVEALRQRIVAGQLRVPSRTEELSTFKPVP